MFKHLLNEAAFIDRIDLSVWATEKPVTDGLLDRDMAPILTRNSQKPDYKKSKSLYAYRVSGKSNLTSNPVRLVYGKVSRLPRVPPMCVALWSEAMPVTGAQVNETLRMLLPNATRVQPVSVELTFDFEGIGIDTLNHGVIYRARTWDQVEDNSGSRTIYIGSRRSPWQLKIYDKARGVARFELTLRRGFLSGIGVQQPDNILSLRLLDLRKMFSFCRVDGAEIRREAMKRWPGDQYWQEFACEWEGDGRPMQSLLRLLRGRKSVFTSSPLQRTLEKMQMNLVW